MESNYYIYCIIGVTDAANVEAKGFEKRDVSILPYSDICAIVSETPVTHYDPTLENLQCHENVINNLMASCDVLPMRFQLL